MTQAVLPAAPAQTVEPAAAPISPVASARPDASSTETAPSRQSQRPVPPARPDRTEASPPISQPRSVPESVVAAPPPPVTSAAPPTEPPPPVTAPISEAPVTPPPPKPRVEELVIPKDEVLGIKIDQSLSSETASVEDRVSARLSRDVAVDGRTAIPAGTKLEGVVVSVERGGKMRGRAKLGLQFSTLILADGLRVPIETTVIFREGAAPGPEATAKIGASAVVGAAVGAAVGGKKGAAIGSGAGAAGGTAAVMAGGRNEAVFASGAPLTLRLVAPVTIVIPREPDIR